MPGSVPKASASRNAIAAVNDARPFSRRESVDRATRSFFAATPTCTPPRYSRRISPGCAWLYIVIPISVLLLSVVILIIDQDCILIFEREGHAPVAIYLDRPVISQLVLKRVKIPAR